MREKNFLFLVFLHNMVFSLLIVLNSVINSLLLSAIGLTYWIIGWLIIFKKRKSAEIKNKEAEIF
jgi:hypothetical protein